MKIIKCIETKDGFTMDSFAYSDYVKNIKQQVPENALSYMSASWHYDPSDPRCLHDSNLENYLFKK